METETVMVSVRVPAPLLAALEETLQAHNCRPQRGHWSRSQFMLDAIRQRIEHLRRGRRGRGACNTSPQAEQ